MQTAKVLVRDRALRAWVALAAVVSVVFPAGWGTSEQQVLVYWLIQVGLDVAFTLGGRRLSRLAVLPMPARRFWRLITIGSVFFVAADALQAVLYMANPSGGADASTAQGILVVAGVGCGVWAMVRHPIQAQGRARLRWWLDAATVLVGAGVFAWYFSISNPGAGQSTADLAITLVTTGVTLLAAFGLVKLLLGGNAPFTRPAGVAGGLSLTLIAVFTGAGPAFSEALPQGVVLALRLLPLILFAATPRIQEVQLSADPGVLVRRQRPYSRLPYLAVAATHTLLISALLGAGLGIRTWGVLTGVVIGTGLVVVRQLVGFSDNARLLASLDEAVLVTRQQEERFRSLVQHASDLTLVATEHGTVSYASPAANRVLGLDPDQLSGRRITELVHPDDLRALGDVVRDLLATPGGTITSQVRTRHSDGSWRWLEFTATNLLHNPSVNGLICNARDITDARQFQERLQHQATHDALTGLANRALFDELARPDGGAGRRPTDTTAVVAIDLNDFKTVNDTLGHHVGDALLIAVAERLLSCVRPTDTVARLGGDEFAILLPGLSEPDVEAVAVRITNSLIPPVTVDGHDLTIRASIGTAVGPRDQVGLLLRTADAAMYHDKRSTKQAVH